MHYWFRKIFENPFIHSIQNVINIDINLFLLKKIIINSNVFILLEVDHNLLRKTLNYHQITFHPINM